MPRIRSIKPEFFTSETIARLNFDARLTFIGLWTYVDDRGRALADARLIKAAVWPLDNRMTAKRVDKLLGTLQGCGLIVLYKTRGRNVLQVVGWAEHQRVSHPTASKFDAPQFPNDSGEAPESLGSPPENFVGEGKGKERKGKEGRRTAPLAVGTIPESAGDRLAPIAAAHDAIYGDGSFASIAGRFVKVWKKLLEAHGAEKCAAVWKFAHTTGTEREREFRTPEKVAAQFARFDPDSPAEPEAAA